MGVLAALAMGIIATDMSPGGNEGASISVRAGGRKNQKASCGKQEHKLWEEGNLV